MSNSARKRVNRAARERRLARPIAKSSFPDIRYATLERAMTNLNTDRVKQGPKSLIQQFTYDGSSVVRFEVPPEVGPEYAVLIAGPSGEIACQLEKWATYFTADMKDCMGYNFPAGRYMVSIVYTPS